jgi:hypothetical protein
MTYVCKTTIDLSRVSWDLSRSDTIDQSWLGYATTNYAKIVQSWPE